MELSRVFAGQYVRVMTGDTTYLLGKVVTPPSSPGGGRSSLASVLVNEAYYVQVPLSRLRRSFLVILDLNGVLGSRVMLAGGGPINNGNVADAAKSAPTAAAFAKQLSSSNSHEAPSSVIVSELPPKHRAFVHRPELHAFLKYLFQYFHVGVWTSAQKENSERIIEAVFGPTYNDVDYARRLVFCHYQEQTTKAPTSDKQYAMIKDLKYVWDPLSGNEKARDAAAAAGDAAAGVVAETSFSMHTTIIIDDTPDKCSHPNNSVCPPPFAVTDLTEDSRKALSKEKEAPGLQYCIGKLKAVTEQNSLDPIWRRS